MTQNFVLAPVIESAFKEESFDYLNKIIAQHRLKAPDERTLSFYQHEIPRYINRLILLGIYVCTFLWVILKNNAKIFKDFFLEERSALSLGILRIVTLSLILYINFPASVNNLIALGSGAIVPPLGWNTDLIFFITQPAFAYSLNIFFIIFCLGSLFGLYTRTMLIGATITGFFVMGIPQFYGKIDHYHLLWHVLLILSMSRAGDSLSIDAWKRQLPQINLNTSIYYGVPLKIVMILIGLGYFFPGFWKFVFSGFDWIFSNNLQLKMHSKWLDLGGWTPAFRIDQYPLLYQAGALFTVAVELGFIFALFFKKVRSIFVLAAFGFHLMVYYFMKIPFFSTMALFVIFINWQKIFTSASYSSKKASIPKKSDSFFFRKFTWVGTFLITGYLISGSLLINSWPFAVYPTFASIESDTVPTLYIEAINEKSGHVEASTIPLLNDTFTDQFSSTSRLRGYIREIINSQNQNSAYFGTLEKIFSKEYLSENNQTTDSINIHFYQIRLNTNPDPKQRSFTKEKLLYTSK
ncbi:MAG: hypothetical protein FH748_15815 [Balneolaceae bacterium]|nr:hypothetical protein [Balneolaceae bacterium]